MKILLVQDHLRSGGTERQTVLLANAFAASGHQTSVLTFRPGGVLAPTLAQRVTRHVLQQRDFGWDWFAPRLASTTRRLQPDVILCHGRMANCFAGHLKTATRPNATPVIATLRTGKSLPWLYRRSLHQVDHIITNSHDARDTLRQHDKIPESKISVIHNPLVFPPTETQLDRAHTRARHGADALTCVLLDAAMFRPEKNQAALLEIVASLPANFPWQLWLAGDGPTRPHCEALAHKFGIRQKVKFLGFVADPSPLYRAADLAVHASRRESLSNFLIEAQAHGLPVVAAASRGVAECFIEGVTGICVPQGDPAAFHTAILRLSRPDESRRARARDFARTQFSAPVQVQAHLDLFQRLLHTSRP